MYSAQRQDTIEWRKEDMLTILSQGYKTKQLYQNRISKK